MTFSYIFLILYTILSNAVSHCIFICILLEEGILKIYTQQYTKQVEGRSCGYIQLEFCSFFFIPFSLTDYNEIFTVYC